MIDDNLVAIGVSDIYQVLQDLNEKKRKNVCNDLLWSVHVKSKEHDYLEVHYPV